VKETRDSFGIFRKIYLTWNLHILLIISQTCEAAPVLQYEHERRQRAPPERGKGNKRREVRWVAIAGL
jgi:hypothetical protein